MLFGFAGEGEEEEEEEGSSNKKIVVHLWGGSLDNIYMFNCPQTSSYNCP